MLPIRQVRMKDKKCDYIKELKRLKLDHDPKMTKKELWAIIRKNTDFISLYHNPREIKFIDSSSDEED